MQVLQAEHAAGRAAQREAQQPQEALGQDDDGIGVRGGRAARPAGQQPREGGAVGAQGRERGVGRVVEREHGAGNRAERAPTLDRAPREHGQPPLRGPGGDLVEQAGLADPGLAGDQQRAPAAGRDGVDEAADRRELGRAADDDGAAQDRGGPGGGGGPGRRGGGAGVHGASTAGHGVVRKGR